MSRDLSIGVAFRSRGTSRAARDVRAVNGAVRATGSVSRTASGSVASLVRQLGAATRKILGYGDAHRRAAARVRETARATDAARRSAERHRRALAGVAGRGAVRAIGGGVLRGLAGSAAGFGVLRGGTQMLTESVALNARLVRLMTDAKGDRHWIGDVWESALAAARKYGVGIEGVLDGVSRVISDTGDKAFAASVVDPIARTMQAWGAAGTDLGMLAAQVRRYGVDVQTGLEIAASSGARGSVPLPALATVAGDLLGGVGGMGGWGGREEYAQILAMLQAVATITGGAEGVSKAVTAMEAFTRSFLNPEVRKQLEKQGVNVYDDGRLLSPFEVLDELIRWSGGDMQVISSVFRDAEQLKALLPIMGEDGRRKLEDFRVDPETARRETQRALDPNASTTQAHIERIGVVIDELTKSLDDLILNPVIERVAVSAPGAAAKIRAATEGAIEFWEGVLSAAVRAEEWLEEKYLLARRWILTGGLGPDPRDKHTARDHAVSLAAVARQRIAADHGPLEGTRVQLGSGAADRLAGLSPMHMLAPTTPQPLPRPSPAGDTIINVNIDGRPAADEDLADIVAERIAAEQALQRQTAQHD